MPDIYLMEKEQFITFLQKYKPIPAYDRQLIADAFELRLFKEGDTLFESNHICKQLFFICNGVLKIVIINEKGNPVIHYFLTGNRFCTILNSFNNNVIATESIQAACDTWVLAISKNRLLALYEKAPYLSQLIDYITHHALLDKINVRNAYLGHDSAGRYQLFLERQPDIALKVPLTDIASYLGITPQSLSRIRKNIR